MTDATLDAPTAPATALTHGSGAAISVSRSSIADVVASVMEAEAHKKPSHRRIVTGVAVGFAGLLAFAALLIQWGVPGVHLEAAFIAMVMGLLVSVAVVSGVHTRKVLRGRDRDSERRILQAYFSARARLLLENRPSSPSVEQMIDEVQQELQDPSPLHAMLAQVSETSVATPTLLQVRSIVEQQSAPPPQRWWDLAGVSLMPVAWGLSYFWPSTLSTMFLLGSGALSIASVVRTGREKKRAQAALVDKIGLSSSQMDQVVRAWQHKVAARRRALPAVPSARRQGDSFAEAVAPHAAGLDLLAVQVWRELHGESLQGASTTSTLPARDASREE